ncbi:MAG: ABC transporter substrate-binding protein [Phycisphaeraceae bacterium]|nr:ABC transporter substrate-binding protein [Phycisphaeraceae bacterium]
MTLLKHCFVAASLIGSLLLMGCDYNAEPPTVTDSASPAATLDKVSLQLNWFPEPEFGGIYEAERAGIFKKYGLEVTILQGGPNVPAVQLVTSGRVDMGIAAADEVINFRLQGDDLVAIFATYQTSPQGIMVHDSNPAGSIPELLAAGGDIAVQPEIAYVKYFEKKYDVSKIRFIAYDGGVAQFLNNPAYVQQCFVFSEPVAAKQQGAKPKVFLIADTGFNPYTAVVVTRGEFLKKNHEIAARFAAALAEGWRAYLDNPAPANEMMAKLNPNMDLKTFAQAAEAQKPLIENQETAEHGLGSMSKERWIELSKQLVEIGIAKHTVEPEKCFVNLK